MNDLGEIMASVADPPDPVSLSDSAGQSNPSASDDKAGRDLGSSAGTQMRPASVGGQREYQVNAWPKYSQVPGRIPNTRKSVGVPGGTLGQWWSRYFFGFKKRNRAGPDVIVLGTSARFAGGVPQ